MKIKIPATCNFWDCKFSFYTGNDNVYCSLFRVCLQKKEQDAKDNLLEKCPQCQNKEQVEIVYEEEK